MVAIPHMPDMNLNIGASSGSSSAGNPLTGLSNLFEAEAMANKHAKLSPGADSSLSDFSTGASSTDPDMGAMAAAYMQAGDLKTS